MRWDPRAKTFRRVEGVRAGATSPVYSVAVTQTTSAQADEAGIARIQRIGRYLIIFGVLVWGVWLAVKWSGGEANVQYFLPFHLSGVIPGSIMSRWGAIRRWLDRRNP